MARRRSPDRALNELATRMINEAAAREARAAHVKEFLESKSPFRVRETDPEFLALLRAEVFELRRRVEQLESGPKCVPQPKKKSDLRGLVQVMQRAVREKTTVPDEVLRSFSRAMLSHAEPDWVELIVSFSDPTPWLDPLRFLIANRHVDSVERDQAEAHLRVVATNLLAIQGFSPADPDEFLNRGDADEEMARSLLGLS